MCAVQNTEPSVHLCSSYVNTPNWAYFEIISHQSAIISPMNSASDIDSDVLPYPCVHSMKSKDSRRSVQKYFVLTSPEAMQANLDKKKKKEEEKINKQN